MEFFICMIPKLEILAKYFPDINNKNVKNSGCLSIFAWKGVRNAACIGLWNYHKIVLF